MRREQTSPARRRRLRAPVLFAVVVLIAGTTVAACSGGSMSSAGMTVGASAASMTSTSPTGPVMAGTGADLMRADASEAWATRPDFTRVTSETEEAYSYALFHPQVVEWMPCYCGCARMGHRSNLDCYLKPAAANGKTQFEEHASYCDVCVKTTLLTKQLIAQGKSLREIRAAVDSTFGGNAPGTDTPLPPA